MRFVGLVSGRVLARGLAALLQAALLILLARAFPPGVFGTFAAAYGMAIIGAAVLGFGASTRIIRLRAETDPGVIAGLFVLRMTGAILGSLMGAIVFIWQPSAGYAVLVGVAFSVADSVVEFAQAYFAGVERHGISASLPVTLRLLQVATVLSLTWASEPTIAYAVTATSLAVSISCGVLLIRTGLLQERSSMHRRALATLARSSSGYWFAGVVANIRQLEPVVLLGTGSAALAGQYSLVTRLANPLLIVPATLQLIFVPRLVASLEDAKLLRAAMKRLWTVSAGYSIVLLAAAPLIAILLPTVLGPEYEGTFALALAVIAASSLSTLAYVVQIQFIAIGKPWRSSLWIAVYSLLGVAALAVLAGTSPELVWVVPPAAQAILLITLVVVSLRDPNIRTTFRAR